MYALGLSQYWIDTIWSINPRNDVSIVSICRQTLIRLRAHVARHETTVRHVSQTLKKKHRYKDLHFLELIFSQVGELMQVVKAVLL